MTNPYRATTSTVSDSPGACDTAIPRWLCFRFHFLPAILLATLATGEPLAVMSTAFLFLPMLALATECGPWVHPLNLLLSVFTFVAILSLELLKRTWRSNESRVRIAQIAIWWAYWCMFSLALIAGTYRGP